MHNYQRVKTNRLSLGRVYTISWQIFKQYFNVILPVVLIVYLPINALLYYIEEYALDSLGYAGFASVVDITEKVFGIIVAAALILLVQQLVEGQEQELNAFRLIQNGLHRWLDLLITIIIEGLILLGLTFLLILPGIIWGVYYFFSYQVVVLKKLNGNEALHYSKTLVEGQWLRIFWVSLLNLLLILGITYGCVYLYNLNPFDGLLVSIVEDSFLDLIYAYFTIFGAVLFLNIDFVNTNRIKAQIRPGLY